MIDSFLLELGDEILFHTHSSSFWALDSHKVITSKSVIFYSHKRLQLVYYKQDMIEASGLVLTD